MPTRGSANIILPFVLYQETWPDFVLDRHEISNISFLNFLDLESAYKEKLNESLEFLDRIEPSAVEKMWADYPSLRIDWMRLLARELPELRQILEAEILQQILNSQSNFEKAADPKLLELIFSRQKLGGSAKKPFELSCHGSEIWGATAIILLCFAVLKNRGLFKPSFEKNSAPP